MLSTQIQLKTETLQERLNALLSPEVAKIVEDLATLRMLNGVADYASLPAAGLKMQEKLLRKIQRSVVQLEKTTLNSEDTEVSMNAPEFVKILTDRPVTQNVTL